jgi:hypothetical protein
MALADLWLIIALLAVAAPLAAALAAPRTKIGNKLQREVETQEPKTEKTPRRDKQGHRLGRRPAVDKRKGGPNWA